MCPVTLFRFCRLKMGAKMLKIAANLFVSNFPTSFENLLVPNQFPVLVLSRKRDVKIEE